MAVRPEDVSTEDKIHAELVGSTFGQNDSLEGLSPHEAPEWISGNSVQAGIILGYGYKNPFRTIAPDNEDAFDAFARDAYILALDNSALMHHLRNGFTRGQSLIRNTAMDKSVKRVIQAYKTPLASEEPNSN